MAKAVAALPLTPPATGEEETNCVDGDRANAGQLHHQWAPPYPWVQDPGSRDRAEIGSSRGRRTLIVVLLSTKLELSKKCFRQVQDVDYNEVFSLVSMLKSLSESC